ncbi:lantibiotic dehydratase C-terminal domain-containing protein [Streptomyces sp. V4-01]|uniref:Lantibiotic dehydratase C-terminal domain-containing protein n=1 Tax=Actinacidiphila polyblastidii TaxID=3110430 RepID=A0ABU7PJ94_9ACTN|nr:lantibiotic dehydratase C-terminal domain-containing protein [Streptomyces sp. V4-01]
MALTATARPTAAWSSLHCHAYWRPAHTDAFLTGTVAPMLAELRGAGLVEEWFFVRHVEHGPHLRIRVRGAGRATTGDLRARLAAAVRDAPYPADDEVRQAYLRAAADPGTLRAHGEVHEADYTPETARYGGAAALPVAEEVFCRSSVIAAAVVGQTAGAARRLAAATDFVLVTACALGLDALGTVRWLRGGVIGWRAYTDGTNAVPMTVPGAAVDAAAAQSRAVVRRWEDIRRAGASGTRLRDQWAGCVTAARARLETTAADQPDGTDPATGPRTADAAQAADRAAWLQVWLSHLHMLLNRLGVPPEEERALYWFIASSLLAPDGATDYFADHPGAADRRYLDASNFVPSRIQEQRPRPSPDGPKRSRHRPSAGAPTALPAGEPRHVTLHDALALRTSGYGDLGGPVHAEELGALLWPAYAGRAEPGGHAQPSRPYPSAGAQYAARLRLVVRHADGLAPGIYEPDPATRMLLPVAAAPTAAELASASMWFGLGAAPLPRSVDVSTLPVLAGLYVELGPLRARYGLRALRFGYLEAGHLAQNLALTAVAAGLSLGMVGGFHDDVAHELFLLDGIDDVLAYLLPIGRPAPR